MSSEVGLSDLEAMGGSNRVIYVCVMLRIRGFFIPDEVK